MVVCRYLRLRTAQEFVPSGRRPSVRVQDTHGRPPRSATFQYSLFIKFFVVLFLFYISGLDILLLSCFLFFFFSFFLQFLFISYFVYCSFYCHCLLFYFQFSFHFYFSFNLSIFIFVKQTLFYFDWFLQCISGLGCFISQFYFMCYCSVFSFSLC